MQTDSQTQPSKKLEKFSATELIAAMWFLNHKLDQINWCSDNMNYQQIHNWVLHSVKSIIILWFYIKRLVGVQDEPDLELGSNREG